MTPAGRLLACALLLISQGPRPQRPVSRAALPESNAAEPAPVLTAEAAWAGADVLLPMLASNDAAVRAMTARAIGRLEDPALVPHLLSLLESEPQVRRAAAMAVAQSLKGFDPSSNPGLTADVTERLVRIARSPDVRTASLAVIPLGRLVYRTTGEARAAEAVIATVLENSADDPLLQTVHVSAARSLESLARLNPKLVSLDPGTLKLLAGIVNKQSANDIPDARRNALAALIAARSLDSATERMALQDEDEQVRRLAMSALTAGGGGFEPAKRDAAIAAGLEDRSALVRFEALRAYARRVAPERGCGPILDAVRDDSTHVVLAALDALGDLCKPDESVTASLIAGARTPPTIGSWHREAHAFVSLAKRARERASTSLTGFVSHPVWQVRMYAARAASTMDDVAALERLAYDSNDNVREATLGPVYRLKKTDAMPHLLAALERSDYQLLRSSALLLKEVPHEHKLIAPLLDAMRRTTKEAKETSRDTRLALLDAIAQHGEPADHPTVAQFLTDFDPKVAAEAATIVGRWTGQTPLAQPTPPQRGATVSPLAPSACVDVRLKKGRAFRLMTLPGDAPITAAHFLKLALRQHYYDGLTFHRVVPGFVIQGGSPGANEYAGQKEFMRDELGSATNVRGTVGVSTRGRNTGDAQFFVNLVDNPRLDYDYTIFAKVFAEDMPVIDAIEEGDEISEMRSTKCGH